MPSPVPFRKVRKQLEDAGWTLVRVSGSHHIFKRSGYPTVNIAVHRNLVKVCYVKYVEKAIAEAQKADQAGPDEPG